VNEGGIMALPMYGLVSSIALDPIEKKPLAQFLPGSKTFSVGFWHCTMGCPFCQNWLIAHPRNISARYYKPSELVSLALESSAPSISFTYSEPCLHIEYVMECMKIAKNHGLHTVLVTNGNILEDPARDILSCCSAANVDLKSFSQKTYSNILDGDLSTVKKFIQLAVSLCHVEVTSLIVPGILDSSEELIEIGRFINSISKDIPLHITQYHPAYMMNLPPVPQSAVEEITKGLRSIMSNLYIHP
jgi:pyruvate formate lyase activating enzyme